MKKLILLIFWLLAFDGLSAQDRYEMTVAPDGSGDFTSIQKAIDACKAFPDKRVTIFVKNGIYREKVVVPSCNTLLSLVGESPEKTILVWDDFFDRVNRGRNSTFYTYTLLVQGSDFRMENMTVENSAGAVGQAVALHVEAGRCVFTNCRIIGNQDTLYGAGGCSRIFFNGCYVEGTTDFIFGEATMLFESCTIHCKSDSYLTAASTPQGKLFGLVFLHCKITAAENVKKVFLGRPWRVYARVAFLDCDMGSFICPEGWHNWSKPESEKSAFFAEFANTGDGAGGSKRVSWSRQLTDTEAASYTRQNILAHAAGDPPGLEKWYDVK